MASWVQQGCEEYQKRFPKHIRFELVEIPLKKRSNLHSQDRILLEENRLILSKISPGTHLIALDRKGDAISTETLANKLKDYQNQSKNLMILIGGPEGLSTEILDRADEKWSLSAMTFPHPLVRIILIEQIYRALMILAGHPYHRGEK